MAQNANVVDELVVTLTLDSDEYLQQQRRVDGQVNDTEKKQKDVDAKRKTRDKDQIKRNKDSLKSIKELAAGMKGLALTVASLLGVGSLTGIVGSVIALTSMETGLRRASVATGMSNREMQAWGSTARRLGADANAGAAAIADLAREQSTFNITGNGPTMQAFARMGVRIGPDTKPQEALAQAQQIYRQSTPAQQKQIESGLAAQGVSNDLIVMIKSETDAREAFTRSYGEAADENKKALNAVSDALAALGNSAINLANSIATVVQPYVEKFGNYVSEATTKLSTFVTQVMAAGGGIEGFMKVLNEQSPELAATLRKLGEGLSVLGQGVDVVLYGFEQLGRGIGALYDWLDKKLFGLLGKDKDGGTHPLKSLVGGLGNAIAEMWHNTVDDARRNGPAPVGKLTGDTGGAQLTPDAKRRLYALDHPESVPPTAGAAPVAAPPGTSPKSGDKAQDMMHELVQRGFTVNEAAAITANAEAESRLDPTQVNKAGGGNGARGLFQWRGDRLKAFQAKYGKTPDQASMQEQLDFLTSDPQEVARLRKSLAAGGSAQSLGTDVSRVFESHGNVAEDARRGVRAGQLASSFGGTQNATNNNGQTISIQTVNVQANNPTEFVGGIQRVSGVQNYNAAVR